ncbi:hypothetical protein CRG98_048643, partial [Punica granatum]
MPGEPSVEVPCGPIWARVEARTGRAPRIGGSPVEEGRPWGRRWRIWAGEG